MFYQRRRRHHHSNFYSIQPFIAMSIWLIVIIVLALFFSVYQLVGCHL